MEQARIGLVNRCQPNERFAVSKRAKAVALAHFLVPRRSSHSARHSPPQYAVTETAVECRPRLELSRGRNRHHRRNVEVKQRGHLPHSTQSRATVRDRTTPTQSLSMPLSRWFLSTNIEGRRASSDGTSAAIFWPWTHREILAVWGRATSRTIEINRLSGHTCWPQRPPLTVAPEKRPIPSTRKKTLVCYTWLSVWPLASSEASALAPTTAEPSKPARVAIHGKRR